jgi:hypothetical protein
VRFRLGTIFPQSKLLIPTQAEDSSDSIAQVKPQLIFAIHMTVRIDQSGNDRLSARIDDLYSRRDLHVFAHSRDVAILYQKGAVFNRWFAGAVDDACTHPGLSDVGILAGS